MRVDEGAFGAPRSAGCADDGFGVSFVGAGAVSRDRAATAVVVVPAVVPVGDSVAELSVVVAGATPTEGGVSAAVTLGDGGNARIAPR